MNDAVISEDVENHPQLTDAEAEEAVTAPTDHF